jgi:hypothetical protein
MLKLKGKAGVLQDIYKKPDPQRAFLHSSHQVYEKDHVVHQILGAGTRIVEQVF